MKNLFKTTGIFTRLFVWLLAVCCFYTQVVAQQQARHRDNITFYHLTKSQGLSANLINTLCTDKSNNLWIGTLEGLNRFNGKTVTQYLSQQYPQLSNDNIQGLVCDEQNQVWVRCDNGSAVVLDEARQMHKVAFSNNGEKVDVRKIINTTASGIILFTSNGFFVYKAAKLLMQQDSLTIEDFSPLIIDGLKPEDTKVFVQLEKIDENRYVLTRQKDVTIINFKENKIETRYAYTDKWALLLWKPDELLIYDRKTKLLELLHLRSQVISYPFKNMKDQFGETIAPRVHTIKKLSNGNLVMATNRDGLYFLDTATKKLTHYLERPGDASAPPTNRPNVLHATQDGWVFFGSRYNGVGYFKHSAVVGQQSFFADDKGNSYNGYINSIVQKNNEEYYIGTGTNLLLWHRITNKTTFVNYASFDGKPVVNEEGATIVAKDKLGRLWFLTSTRGIVVIDKNEKLIKQFPSDTVSKNGIMSNWAEYIIHGPDNWVWIGTQNGVRRINPINFEIDDLSKTAFNALRGTTCMEIFFDDPGYIWIPTSGRGLWKYTISTKKIEQLTPKQGLISNRIYGIEKDLQGNLYIGSDRGLQIFYKNGRTKIFSSEQGLVNNRVNILMRDNKNRMWLGNVNAVACYNPVDSSIKYFDQRYGLLVDEIRPWAYYTAADGEMFWGTEKGIEFFYPDSLYNNQSILKASVTALETGKLKQDITQSKYFRLQKEDNDITFYFSTSGFLPMLNNFYKYKLEGQDQEWKQVSNQNFVRYNSLAPGKYVFKMLASSDNKNWVEAENQISIYIPPPFYKTWWFRTLAALAAAGSIFYFIKRREKNIKKKEAEKTEIEKLKAGNYQYQLEIEQVIGFFGATIHQHDDKDELLWDVAKNLIGKLGFEDCMIYLWNEDKTLLLQKAGYGSKGSMQNEIYKNIYHVPKGKGIVGAAVESGRYILANDTTLDKRYFYVDDKIRLSELCVPIIHNNKAIGAINTEHTAKNFYTERHLQILITIASMLADKIDMIAAQHQTREKEVEVLKLNKDLATSQLTTLRAQMNPHFIFNALNSVQQYILQGNVIEANKYLSKFSKLQREVLNHSDQDFISLEKELEVLHLYLELEQLRFDGNFTYEIKTDAAIDVDEIKIPPMIIQPFVENSIWHGLMPKLGERWVHIQFEFNTDELLVCTVTDNGIGRDASARLKQNSHGPHKSKGLSLVYDRLNILRQQYGQAFEVTIKDLFDCNNVSAGTEVKLHIYTG